MKTRLGGELYARSKWAVIMGDGTTFGALPNAGFDLVRNQWELGMGYEHNICLRNGIVITPSVGAEWITFTGSEAGIGLPEHSMTLPSVVLSSVSASAVN